MVNKIEIRPADGRKSFYGKAKMVQYDEYWAVISYGKEVALMRKTDEGNLLSVGHDRPVFIILGHECLMAK